jgi:YD repeat-containing protein
MRRHEASFPVTYTLDAANRLVTRMAFDELTTFTYDNNGNLTNEQRPTASTMITFVYDGENRIINVLDYSNSPNRYTYAYDGDGLRRSVHLSTGAQSTFIWDGDDILMERTP